MTVISVTPTDVGRETLHWELPQDNLLNMSPIPRGLRIYGGNVAIAALGTNDETNVDVKLTFPTAFVYLPKSLSLEFASDDLTTEFENLGSLEYRPGGSETLGTRKEYQMLSDGASFRAAVRSVQIYRPEGTWRQWVGGPDGDNIHIFLSDISNDASTAGDVAWTADFWEYDVEQCFKWPVNTPQPQVTF